MKAHSLSITILLGSILCPAALAEIYVAPGASLSINGNVTTNTIHVQNGGTLSGDGQATASIIADSGGIVSPGGSPGTLTATGTTTLAGTFKCEVDISDTDKLVAQGTLDLSGATLQLDDLSGGNLGPIYLLADYGTLSGAAFSQVLNLPPGYVIDYSYFDGSDTNNIALIATTVPYQTWAATVGLTPGLNDGVDDDPNQDGILNLVHFAYDTNPLGNGSDEGKQQLAVTEVAGEDHLSITVPIRIGAVFTGTPSPLATIDGFRFSVRANEELPAVWTVPALWTVPVEELSPALDSGLPPLNDSDGDGSADWEYRTFRLSDPMSMHPRSFLQLSVEQAP